MRIQRAPLLAVLTTLAMLLAVPASTAVAVDDWGDWDDDDRYDDQLQ